MHNMHVTSQQTRIAMTNQQIEQFCMGLGSFAWNNNFEQFCQLCGFNPDHQYSMEKFKKLSELNQLLSQFDNEIMTKIVRAGLKLPTEKVEA